MSLKLRIYEVPWNYWYIEKIRYFKTICVDPNNEEGRIIVSNYLYGIEKSGYPVIQFSKISNPIMFNKYLSSVNWLMGTTRVWDSQIEVERQGNTLP